MFSLIQSVGDKTLKTPDEVYDNNTVALFKEKLGLCHDNWSHKHERML